MKTTFDSGLDRGLDVLQLVLVEMGSRDGHLLAGNVLLRGQDGLFFSLGMTEFLRAEGLNVRGELLVLLLLLDV